MCLQLVGEYMLYRSDQPAAEALHTVSCRLLLDIMPGLETSVIFQDNVFSVMFVITYKREIIATIVPIFALFWVEPGYLMDFFIPSHF